MLKKLLSFILFATAGLGFNAAGAKAADNFVPEKFPYKEMQIQVMPEFDYPQNWPKDEPSLLVGLYGTITNKTGKDYSGKIEIPVPTKEKNFQVYLVAEFPSKDKPEVQRPYEIDKERGVITFSPEKPIKKDASFDYVVEYYSNPIQVKDKKSFTYEYKAAADIESLDVVVYAPLKATDIVLDPKPASTEKSDYGEQIAVYQQKSVRKGGSYKYSVSYKKDGNDSTLSVIDKTKKPNDENHNSSTATDAVNGAAAGGTGGSGDRPIIGAAGGTIIGVSIIIAAMFVYFGLKNRTNRRNSPSPKNQKDKKSASTQVTGKQTKKSVSNAEEIKELRKKLLNGKIDQEAYDELVKKLI